MSQSVSIPALVFSNLKVFELLPYGVVAVQRKVDRRWVKIRDGFRLKLILRKERSDGT